MLLVGLMSGGCALSQESESPGQPELDSPAADEGTAGQPEEAGIVVRADYGGAIGFVLEQPDLAALAAELREGENLVVVAGAIDVPLAAHRPTVALALTGGEELPLHAVGAAGRRQLGRVQVSLLPEDQMEEVQFEEGDDFATAASCSHGSTRWQRVGFCNGQRCFIPTIQAQAREQMQMCIYGSWYWTQQFRCRFVICP